MADLTLESLMAELKKLDRVDSPDGFLTMTEIIEATKIGRDSITRMVRTLCRSGAMECVKVPRLSICGTRQMVPGYRLVAKEPANGKAKAGRNAR